MFSKIIFSVAVAFTAATGVLATPVVNEAAIALQSRQINQFVTICSNAGLNDCDQINFNFGFCVGNVGRLNDKVSSLNAQGYNCIFYNDTGCRNGGGQIATSGTVNNIRSDPNHSTQNDDVSSFLCNL